MPGVPVVISENGLGLPVKQVESGAPLMTVSDNGLGLPIVLSNHGMAFVVEGAGAMIQLSGTRQLLESAVVGTEVGTATVDGGSGTYTYSTTDPDGVFEIDPDTGVVTTTRTVDFEDDDDKSLSLPIEADNGVDDPISRTFTIQVTNVLEVELNALDLDDTDWIIGTPDSGSITGATSGSTITHGTLPTGLTIDGAARTWAYDGTGTATTDDISLFEAHPDASNNNRESVIPFTTADAPSSSFFELTIAEADISSGPHADFSYPLDMANAPDEFWEAVKSDGSDIIVTDASGAVTLPHFRETFLPLIKRGRLIAKADLPASGDLTLRVYYGDPEQVSANDTAAFNNAYTHWLQPAYASRKVTRGPLLTQIGSITRLADIVVLKDPETFRPVKIAGKYWGAFYDVETTDAQIYMASSDDLLAWDYERVILQRAAGQWDNTIGCDDFLYMADHGDTGTPFWLVYEGVSSSGASPANYSRSGLAKAAAIDGTFTRHSGNPIFETNPATPQPGGGGCEDFRIMKAEDGTWVACYEYDDQLAGGVVAVGLASCDSALPDSGWIDRGAFRANQDAEGSGDFSDAVTNPIIMRKGTDYYLFCESWLHDYAGTSRYPTVVYVCSGGIASIFTDANWQYRGLMCFPSSADIVGGTGGQDFFPNCGLSDGENFYLYCRNSSGGGGEPDGGDIALFALQKPDTTAGYWNTMVRAGGSIPNLIGGGDATYESGLVGGYGELFGADVGSGATFAKPASFPRCTVIVPNYVRYGTRNAQNVVNITGDLIGLGASNGNLLFFVTQGGNYYVATGAAASNGVDTFLAGRFDGTKSAVIVNSTKAEVNAFTGDLAAGAGTVYFGRGDTVGLQAEANVGALILANDDLSDGWIETLRLAFINPPEAS